MDCLDLNKMADLEKELSLEELSDLETKVDEIFKQEVKKAKIKYDIAKSRVYPNIKTVGIQGDDRSYVYVAEITLYHRGTFVRNHKFLQKLSTRIPNEIRDINKVAYVTAIKEETTKSL